MVIEQEQPMCRWCEFVQTQLRPKIALNIYGLSIVNTIYSAYRCFIIAYFRVRIGSPCSFWQKVARCSSYSHLVQSFDIPTMSNIEGQVANDEMDCESEYEEVLVYVDFPNFDECALLTDISVIKLNDLCGENPTCKIGELNFSGKHEINLGTQLFVDKESGKCIGSSVNVLNFTLKTIDTTTDR